MRDKIEDNVYIPHIIEYGSYRFLFERKGYVSMINNDKKYDFETVLLLEKYLIYKERQFGGFVDNIPRVKVSPYDPRSKEEILFGGNRGGDRMASLDNHHGYAAIYAKYLKPFLDNGAHINIAEVGILMGSGLALWCELFPDSDVYGFDINLDYTKNNIPNLKNLGAFSKNEPILHELDQFLDNTQYLQKIFGTKKINICIDDGFHSNETILKSFKSFLPFLAENFVYFIEDNAEVHKELMKEYPELDIEVDGEMTVIYRKAKENLEEQISKPFSVMFISHSSDLNGAERSLFDLITKFAKRGIECAVILHSEGPLKKILNLSGVPVYVIPSSSIWWCKFTNINYNSEEDTYFLDIQENVKNDLLPLVQDLNPDVIYSQTIVKPIGPILAQMAGIPHIVAAREYGELDHRLNFRFGFRESMEALYGDSDVIFTVTNDVRNVVFGKNAAKSVTVYSSVSIDETKLDNGKIEYKQIDKNAVVKVCIPASIQESKGQLDAVRACKILVDNGYNIELNLYGQSQVGYMQIIQKFIDENNLDFYVKVHEFNHNNLKLIYDSDIILSCSVCEAFGRTMLEAALLKRPFVYANSGGTKEVFTDSVHALAYEVGNYAQLAEKIAQTIDQPLEVQQRVEAVYKHVKENFNDSRYVDAQIKAIHNILMPNVEKKSASACSNLINNNIDYKYLANYNADKMINIQLFLSRDGNFSEHNSVIYNSINLKNQNNLILTIPKNFATNNHIRIDLGNRPQILAMTDIRVKDLHNNVIWKWSGDFADLEATNELQAIDRNGMILCHGDDPYIILPVLAENLQLSCIELDMRYLSLAEKANIIYENINEANESKAVFTKQQNEIYNLKNLIDKYINELKSKNQTIPQLNNTINSLNNEINLIKSTKGYRLLEMLRKIAGKLIPSGSKRRTLVKFMFYKPLKFIYKAARYVYRHGISGTIMRAINSNIFTKTIYKLISSMFTQISKTIKSIKNEGLKATIAKIQRKVVNKIKRLEGKKTKEIYDEYGNYTETIFYDYQDNVDFSDKTTDIKALAFYLPQYHTIPENDEWWGKGFTEWSNTRKAIQRFKQHYQPREPHSDIGEYDLTDINVMEKQVKLAKQHGIYGFCFYYYWFSGKRLLEKPIDMLLQYPDIDIPFCFCWANENWTKIWDGTANNVLMKQHYLPQDREKFILDLKKYFDDKRYIRIEGKPIIIVYNPMEIPNIKEEFADWRKYAKKHDIGEILIWTVRIHRENAMTLGIEDIIDAEVDFPPHGRQDSSIMINDVKFLDGKKGNVFDYSMLSNNIIVKNKKPLHPGCMLGWDNSARRNDNFIIFDKFSLVPYYRWLRKSIFFARKNLQEPERFIFINAWNEWAEGSYLEPDKKHGYAVINTTSRALFDMPLIDNQKNPSIEPAIRKKLGIIPYFHDNYTEILLDENIKSKKIAVHLHLYYIDMQDYFIEKLNNIGTEFTLFISVSKKVDVDSIKVKFENSIENAANVIVEKVQNRGRDIAPLIITFGSRLLSFDYICHIHTKKQSSYVDNRLWCDEIVDTLLGSKSKTNQNLNLLYNSARFVYNEPNASIPLDRGGWTANYIIAKEIIERFTKYNIDDFPSIYFPQGSMFWARAEVLKEFLSLPLKYHDFPKEPIPEDGTIAHALERLFLIFVSKYKGFSYCIYKENLPTGLCFYEDRCDFSKYGKKHKSIKVLSYYLPQFDTNTINDKWHGKGFTEWTKVAAAQPLFYEHYQQHIPHDDFGYYHLNSTETLKNQAQLMKESGVYGQIFYHYWFSGKLILEKPAQILLANKDIDMPFCFCWANENWTKKWDGNDAEIILEQKYSRNDAKEFIHYLIPFFKDERYIKVAGRPILYIYRVGSFPDFQDYKDEWEKECVSAGVKPLFLVATLTRGVQSPIEYKMDAAVERVLHDWTSGNCPEQKQKMDFYVKFNGTILDYNDIADYYENIETNKDFTWFRSIVPIWDNTARYNGNAYIIHNSTPRRFQEWLDRLVDYTINNLPECQQFIVVNAWNEWAEGAHLEPDKKFGYAYLNSIGRALIKWKVCIVLAEELIDNIKSPSNKTKMFNSFLKSNIFQFCDLYTNNVELYEFLIQTKKISMLRDENVDYFLYIKDIVVFADDVFEQMLKMVTQNHDSAIYANLIYKRHNTVVSLNESFCIQDHQNCYPVSLVPNAENIKSHKVCTNTFVYLLNNSESLLSDSKSEVSTIIRFHRDSNYLLLERALFSLYSQNACSVQPIIMLQDIDDEGLQKIKHIVDTINWEENKPKIFRYFSDTKNNDLRSLMLYEGIQASETRYISFLDYDDFLYPFAFEWLLSRLIKTDKAVAYGHVYATYYNFDIENVEDKRTSYEYGFTYSDFIKTNHAPIHSFMIDLSRIDKNKLIFHKDQKYLEDYFMMLQIVTENNTDWESLGFKKYIGDYMHFINKKINSLAMHQKVVVQDKEYIKCENRVIQLIECIKNRKSTIS